jgi:hypothetical protein
MAVAFSIRKRMEKATDVGLLIAAVLTFGVGVAHSWLGERKLIGPLVDPATRAGLLAQSGWARRVVRFAWHITTIAWWGMAALLVALALSPLEAQGRYALIAIAVTFAVSGVLTLATSRGRHLAWPVFLAIAGLSLAPLV